MIFPCGVSASDWTQFQFDVYNKGITPDKAPITSPDPGLSWDYMFPGGVGPGSISCPPLIVGDTIYATTKGQVSAINKTTGLEKWTVFIDPSGYQLGSPAYGNNTLFIPGNNGKIYAVDTDGNIKWSVLAGDWLYTPITYDEHKIFFGDCNDFNGVNGKYYCYYDNGTKLWERDSNTDGGYYWAGATVIGEYLVFGDSAGLLTSVYKNNKTIRDEIDVGTEFGISDIGGIKSSVSYNEDNNRLYFTSKKGTEGYLFALGFNADGTFNRSEKYSASILESTSTPTFYNGRLYVGEGGLGNGKLYCFRESDLSKIWEYTPNSGVKASPVITSAYDNGDGEVYIYFTTNTESNSRVYCLRDYPGNTQPEDVWYYQPPSEKNQYTLQGVAISDGWLYYGNDGGYLFGLATEQSIEPRYVFANFTVNITSGDPPLSVEFTDSSVNATYLEWDVDGDGVVDYNGPNPTHTYNESGDYTVTLTASNAYGDDTHIAYINVDWNPWNKPGSDGTNASGEADGRYITIGEVIDAYNCWRHTEKAPVTEAYVTIGNVIDMYNAWRFSEPM